MSKFVNSSRYTDGSARSAAVTAPGARVVCGTGSLSIRPLRDDESLEALTAMLHRAFGRLGAMGLNCTCVNQSASTTRERIEKGECYVATVEGQLAATITLYAPDADSPSDWYHNASVASIHQLAVDTDFQGIGLGPKLLRFAEAWAQKRGYEEIALDTPNPARHLVSFYVSQGYRPVERLHFSDRTYRSVVLSKRLFPASPARGGRVTMRAMLASALRPSSCSR